LVFIPGVANNETAREIISAIWVLNEVSGRDVSINDFADEMDSGRSEQESLSLFKINNNESLTERNGS